MTDPIAPNVAAAFDAYPAAARAQLLAIRRLIFDTAAQTAGVGILTEALKWGEPAYLTEASKSGSTIRLGWSPKTPDRCAIYFNCKTTLVESFRALFADEFAFEGDRALLLDVKTPLAQEPLAVCLAMALAYHRNKRA